MKVVILAGGMQSTLNNEGEGIRDFQLLSATPHDHGRRGSGLHGQYGELPRGYDHKYVYSHFGYNLKATDLQAAIGCAQLEKFPSFVERRRYNFNRMKDKILAADETAHITEKLIRPEACADSNPS